MEEFLSTILKAIIGGSAVAAVIGGLYRLRAGKQAQARQETRGAIDDVRGQLDRVQDLARQYYGKAGSNDACPALALEIRSTLQRIGTRVTVLHHRLNEGNRSILTCVYRLKQAVSLDLDAKLREQYSAEDARFVDIQTTAEALLLELERRFDREY